MCIKSGYLPCNLCSSSTYINQGARSGLGVGWEGLKEPGQLECIVYLKATIISGHKF